MGKKEDKKTEKFSLISRIKLFICRVYNFLVKKVFLFILHFLFKILNYLAIALLCFLVIVIIFITFELPVFGANKLIERNVDNLTIGSVYIRWNVRDKIPVFFMRNLEYEDTDLSLSLDNIGVSFSFLDIFKKGELYITFIELNELKVYFVRNTSEKPPIVETNNTELNISEILQQLYDKKNSKKNQNYNLVYLTKQYKNKFPLLRSLKSVGISDSEIRLKDKVLNLETQTIIKYAQLDINKTTLNIFADAQLIWEDKNLKLQDSMALKINTKLNQKDEMDFNIELLDIDFGALSQKATSLAELKTDVIMQNFVGKAILKGEVSLKDGVKSVYFDVAVDTGYIESESLLEEKVRINKVDFASNYRGEKTTLFINDISVEFGTSIFRLKPIKYDALIKQITARASVNLSTQELNIDSITFDLNNLIVKTSGNLDFKNTQKMNIKLQSSVDDLLISDIKTRFPKDAFSQEFTWFDTHINNGMLKNITINLDMLFGNGKPEVNNFMITSKAENLDLFYVDTMPKIQVSAVDINYDFKKEFLSLDLKNARTNGLRVENGKVTISNIAEDIKAKKVYGVALDMKYSGNVVNALEILDSKPLELISTNGLKEYKFRGLFKGHTKLLFDITNETMKDISVDLDVEDAYAYHIFSNQDVKNGKLKLKLAKNILTLDGNLTYMDSPTVFNIKYDFNEEAPVLGLYNIDFNVSFLDIIELGILPKMLTTDIEGLVAGHLVIKQFNTENMFVDFKVDMSKTFINKKNISFFKETGVEFNVGGQLNLINSKLATLSNLNISSPNILVKGDIIFNKEGNLETLEFSKLFINDFMDLSTTAVITPDRIYVSLKGNRMDTDKLFNLIDYVQEEAKKEEISKKPQEEVQEQANKLPSNYNIAFNMKEIGKPKLYMAKGMQASFVYDDFKLNKLRFRSDIGNPNKAIFVDLKDNVVNFDINHMGEILNIFGFTNKIKEGHASGNIVFSYGADNSIKTKGKLDIADVRIAGFDFSEIKSNFTSNNYIMNFSRLHSIGSIITFDVSGFFDFQNQTMDVSGNFTPISTTLNVLGKIPVFGTLLVKKSAWQGTKNNNNENVESEGTEDTILTIKGRIKGKMSDPEISFE